MEYGRPTVSRRTPRIMSATLPLPLSLSIGAAGMALLLASCTTSEKIRSPLPPAAPAHSDSFRQAMGNLVGPGFTAGNRITTLNNGAEIFPAMLGAIRSAKRTINFETFVYYHGEIPEAFADALAERARAGVQVNVILDAVGALKSQRYHKALREAGVQLAIYHPLRWWDFFSFNYRTHRKLLIVDGTTGFTGGVGIADDWDGDARSPAEWRELHYKIEGPVVAQMQAIFAENWFESRREVLQGPTYFPALRRVGSIDAGAFAASPKQSDFDLELMYHLAIASARRSIYIESPYFIPDRTMTDALVQAGRSGVDIRILMPGPHIDQGAVRRASRKRWPKLLASGVRLYEYEPTMIHSKLMIVDGIFVTVGSANFDPRSIRINDEANLNIVDEDFAAQQTRIFFDDLRQSRPIDPNDFGIKTLVELPLGTLQTPLESQL